MGHLGSLPEKAASKLKPESTPGRGGFPAKVHRMRRPSVPSEQQRRKGLQLVQRHESSGVTGMRNYKYHSSGREGKWKHQEEKEKIKTKI